MTSSGPPSTSSSTAGADDAASMLELESLVDAATFDDKVCLEDFTLIRVIGKGSFGKVTLVRKKTNSKIFAMKILSKAHLLKRKQVEHTKTERRVLSVASHPFIVGLHYAFQTQAKLYFVLDYCPGGELFFHLSRMGKFDETMSRFYAAELVVALEHLHSLGVVYRDLKPENILLDEMGHIKLADFGLAKDEVTEIDSGATSLCGTPEYLAPEVLARKGHGTAVDWWGLGMVLYEMLTGLPPWYTRNRQE
ncbi:Agc protein kinase, partial [Globisporangium polare]